MCFAGTDTNTDTCFETLEELALLYSINKEIPCADC